jgi:hypothetical protein
MTTDTQQEENIVDGAANSATRMLLAAQGINQNPHLANSVLGRAASKVIGANLAIESLKGVFDTLAVPFFGTSADKALKSAGEKARQYVTDPENREKMDAFKKDVLDTGKESLASAMNFVKELIEGSRGLLGDKADGILNMINEFGKERAVVQSQNLDSRQASVPAGKPPATPVNPEIAAAARAAANSREGRN